MARLIWVCRIVMLGLLQSSLATACTGKSPAAAAPAPGAAPLALRDLSRDREDDRSADLAAAKEAFFRAVEGDRQVVDESRRTWQEIHAERGGTIVAAAYLGASTVLAAKHARWPWQQGSLARDGMALLDRAVREDPADLEVRFLRGMTNHRLPRFLGRSDLAAEDLAFVARSAHEAATSGRLPRAIAAAALYQHATVCIARGDRSAAVAACRAAVDVGPHTPGGRAAAAWLAGADGPG